MKDMFLNNNLTLDKMSDFILQESKKTFKPRQYMGMSEIGKKCYRALWYGFRNVLSENDLSLKSILAIEDGYRQELVMADRLRMVPGIDLKTLEANGEQIGFIALGGHLAGHCDGIISGIFEAPKTPHIWEHKAVNESKFNKLKKLIEGDEKTALAQWDNVYYVQAVMYMYFAKLKRHFLTVSTPGGRDYISCRTESDTVFAKEIIKKAISIISADSPPARLSENRSFYECSWCKFKGICFDAKVPAVNCRTCVFSEPDTIKGGWKCFDKPCDGLCDNHLFLNSIVPMQTIEIDKSTVSPSWIKYQDELGKIFYNITPKANKTKLTKCLTSKQIYDLEYFELIFMKRKEDEPELKNNKKLSGEI